MASENGNGGGLEGNTSACGSSSFSFKGIGRRNIRGNKIDNGWKYGVNGDARKVKCSFCLKGIYGRIYRFKYRLAR